MALASKSSSGTRTLARAVSLIRAIAVADGRGERLADLARTTNLHRATAHRLLLALCDQGLVERDNDSGRFRLGMELFVWGSRVSERLDLRSIAQASCDRLCLAFEDTVYLSVRRGLDSVCIDRREGEFPIRTLTLEVGSVRPLGVGAGSLALLSALRDDELEGVLVRLEERLRPYPSFDLPMLRQLAAETRARGYAFNDQRLMPGMSAVGVSIVTPGGALIGALSVAAISSRMTGPRREQIAQLLRHEAAIVSQRHWAPQMTIRNDRKISTRRMAEGEIEHESG